MVGWKDAGDCTHFSIGIFNCSVVSFAILCLHKDYSSELPL